MPIFSENRELLDSFRRGDRAALEQVYYRYVGDVELLARCGFTLDRNTSTTILGVADRDQQRDIVQEVFVRAFSGRARLAYDGVRPYRPYLLRIAKNLMIDKLRGAHREPSTLHAFEPIDIDAVLETDGPLGAAVTDLADTLHWKQLTAATDEYISGLDEPLASIVRLRFRDEHSQHETAAALSFTRRRVRTLEKRARDGLRRHLRARKLL